MAMTRTATLVKGLASLLLLGVLVLGLPVALLAVGGSPLPTTGPDPASWWRLLTSRDDGTVLLAVLRVAAWAGWALFTASVLADLVARARHVRVPHLGPQQALASQLVAAVAALAMLAPGAAAASPAGPPAPPTVATSSTSSTAASGVNAWASLADADRPTPAASSPGDAAAAQDSAWREHRVVRGDTLWDLAVAQLGSGYRWTEIYAASAPLPQPGGARMEDPDLILPGWRLRVPAADSPPVAPPATRTLIPPPPSPVAPGADADQERVDAPPVTPLSTAAALAGAGMVSAAPSTPLSSPAATPARDWRAMIRDGVPELE
jgi:hypothetical protein